MFTFCKVIRLSRQSVCLHTAIIKACSYFGNSCVKPVFRGPVILQQQQLLRNVSLTPANMRWQLLRQQLGNTVKTSQQRQHCETATTALRKPASNDNTTTWAFATLLKEPNKLWWASPQRWGEYSARWGKERCWNRSGTTLAYNARCTLPRNSF